MTEIDVFSGFLGAGKTTLIKKLIKEAYQGEKLVLIENEFGEIGIDGGFMKEAGIEITEMNSGCICCSLVGDFSKALQKVISEIAPDRILIEPSGVGKLSDVLGAISNVSDQAKVSGIVTVVDAGKFRVYSKNYGEFFHNQIESAATIILSHTDTVTEKKLAECVEGIREKNAEAVLVTTPWNEISGEQIMAAIRKSNTLQSILDELEADTHRHGHHAHEHEHDDDEDECSCGHHHHDHDHDDDEDGECSCGHDHHDHDHDDDEDGECSCGHHHHDHNHDDDEDGECSCGHHHHHDHHHHDADEIFSSWGKETTKTFTASELNEKLEALMDESEYGIVLRAKGIVKGTDGWLHFDYVPGEPDVRSGSADITGRLCVIGSQLKEEKIAALFGV